MKKFIISLSIMFVILLSALSSFFIVGACQEEIYSETYYGAFKDKIALIEKESNKRLVFVGGSALPFGLVSEEINKSTGYNVVNFGLYGALGSKDMLDIVEEYLKEGDVLVFVPELSSDTYSLYQNPDALWKCIEGTNLFYKLPLKTQENMFYHYFNLVVTRSNEEKIEQETPYNRASFNEYGDINKELIPQNIMPDYYDSTQIIEPNEDLIDEEFVKYVNEYYKGLKKKGIDMVFSFSPSNSLAINKEGINDFMVTIDEELDCPIIGSVEDFVFHQYYFYDTNFHLNESGAYSYTKKISELLCSYLNIESNYEIPTKGLPNPLNMKSNITVEYGPLILGEIISNGVLNYSVNGVKDEFLNLSEIAIPEKYNDAKIVSVVGKGFQGMSNLKNVYFPSTIESFQGIPFSGCTSLENIYLTSPRSPMIGNNFLDGTNETYKINVSSETISLYRTGYTWSKYKKNIVTFEYSSIVNKIDELLKMYN